MLVAVLANFDFGNVSEVRTWVSPIRLGYFEFVKIIGKAMISVFTKDPSLGIKPGSLLAILRYPIIDMSISET